MSDLMKLIQEADVASVEQNEHLPTDGYDGVV